MINEILNFAGKYSIEIKPVVYPTEGQLDISDAAFTEYGVLRNSGEFDGQSSEQAIKSITEWLELHESGEATDQLSFA